MWTIAHASAGSLLGAVATTPPLDTTSLPNLFVHLSYNATFGTPALMDSFGNVWTPLTPQVTGGGDGSAGFHCEGAIVGPGHTFTGTGVANGSKVTICVLAAGHSGTPAFDADTGAITNGAASLQPGAITPAQNDALLITGITFGGAAVASAIDSGFTIQEHVSPTAGASSGALASLDLAVAAPTNPAWTPSFATDMATEMMDFVFTGGPPPPPTTGAQQFLGWGMVNN